MVKKSGKHESTPIYSLDATKLCRERERASIGCSRYNYYNTGRVKVHWKAQTIVTRQVKLRVNLFKFKNIRQDVIVGEMREECKSLGRVGEGDRENLSTLSEKHTSPSQETQGGGRGESKHVKHMAERWLRNVTPIDVFIEHQPTHVGHTGIQG